MQLKVSNSPAFLLPLSSNSKMPHRLTLLFLAVLFAGVAYYLYARSLNQRVLPPPKVTPKKSAKQKADTPTSPAAQNGNSQAQKLYEQRRANQNNIDQSIDSLKAALNCKPADPNLLEKIHFKLGNYYNKKREYDQAISSYSQAVSLDLKTAIHARSLFKRGQIYDFQKQDLKKALQDYEAVIRCIEINRLEIQIKMMAYLFKSNALYRQATSKETPDQEIMNQALEPAKLAYELAEKANASPFLKMEIYYQRAICLHVLGQHNIALVDYTVALDQDVANSYAKARTFCDRALCYEQWGQHTLAREDYDQAATYSFTEQDKVDSLTRIPLKNPPPGTPASYKNTAELRAAIEAGQARTRNFRTPPASPSKQDTYFQTPHKQPAD